MQLQLSWAHGGVKINCSKLHGTLKINPRIGNYQNHKNPSQAFHEDGKKSLKKWRSLAKNQEERKEKLDLAVFFIFMIEKDLVVIKFDNAVVDAIKLILLNYSNVNIAKIVVNKIERVK